MSSTILDHASWEFVNIPLRPSDFHNFSLSIRIGPTYTIKFQLWINSIRDGKAFVFRIGNSTRHGDEENDLCGHEMPSVSTKEHSGNHHLAIKFDCNKQDFGKDIRLGIQSDCEYSCLQTVVIDRDDLNG